MNSVKNRAQACAASIILPVRDQRIDWLNQCVQSALGQTVPCELIVIYSEHTRAEAVEFLLESARVGNSVRVCKRQPGTGFASAINQGLELVTCERFGFVLSDDWLRSDCLETCLNSDADIVSSSNEGYDEHGEEVVYQRLIDSAGYERCSTDEERARYLGHFFLLRTDRVRAIGGVDETVGQTGCDDFDLIWSLLERGASVCVEPETLYFTRDHAGERLTTRARDRQIRDLTRVFNKHRVPAEKQAELMQIHSHWFGRPVHVALRELEQRSERES